MQMFLHLHLSGVLSGHRFQIESINIIFTFSNHTSSLWLFLATFIVWVHSSHTYEYVYIHWYAKALLMCHLLFYPLSIYIKWSLLTISFFFCFIWYLSTGCQHRLYPFPDEGLLCALMCVHLNLLCSNKDVLYKICFRRRGNFYIFGKSMETFVCARLYCRKCTLFFLKVCCIGW